MTKSPVSPNSLTNANSPIDLDTSHSLALSDPNESLNKNLWNKYVQPGSVLGFPQMVEGLVSSRYEPSSPISFSLLKVASCSLSAICMASIIGILGFYNNEHLPHWSHGVTLGTFISVSSKVSLISLFLPVCEAYVELIWDSIRGNNDRKMLDFEIFENGSPRPWDDFLFLARIRRRYLATLGVVGVLVTLCWDSCFQQAVIIISQDVKTVPGSTYNEEPIVRVRWVWLALPLGIHALTYLFLILSIRMKQPHERVLKISANASLLYDAPDEIQNKITSSQATGAPRVKAKTMKVKWLPRSGWRTSSNEKCPTFLKTYNSNDSIGKQHHANQEYRQDSEDDTDVVLSVQSIMSSSQPKHSVEYSGYEELLAIFQKDAGLVLLSRQAVEDPDIGPVRLQQNLERLLSQYAKDLKREAKDRLEHLASQLVSLKAAFLSRCIVEWCSENAVKLKQKETQLVVKSTENDKVENTLGDSVETAMEDIYFEDLATFRNFLLSSNAFQTLYTEVKNITLPRPSRKTKNGSIATSNDIRYIKTKASVIADRILHGFEKCLVATGYLEHPLEPGMVRLRWECRCGERFTADAREYEPCGGTDLKVFVEKLMNSQVTLTQYSSKSTNQKAIYPQPRIWLQKIFARLGMVLKMVSRRDTLPQHNLNSVTIQEQQAMSLQPPKLLHVLACMRSTQLGKILHQGCIDNIDTDRKLFCFLRQLFMNHRGRFCFFLSLKKVKGIHFTRLNLFAGGSVEVRHHSHCCENICECIPPLPLVEPSDQAEYRCKPAGPLRSGPPVLPDILENFFSRPSCILEHNISILNRLPKRICGELQGSVVEPAEGWGIYYEEGWDGEILTMLAFIIFLIGSLLFGVLWSCFKMDLQGAFGVSAYIMTANAIVISLIASRAGKV